MRRLLILPLLILSIAARAAAQDVQPDGVADAGTATANEASSSETETRRALLGFLAGGALGLGLHESGHLLFDVLFDADPGIKPVSFGPLPFFAITHREVSPVRELTIASAGFWMQHASSEWILTRDPDLRERRAPVRKGILAFNIAASSAYGVAALAKIGPSERDTRGMARALQIDEGWVGVMLVAPAALDVWRYYRPESRTARWSSRAIKAGMVLLILSAKR